MTTSIMSAPVVFKANQVKLDKICNNSDVSVYPLDISIVLSVFGGVTAIAKYSESGVTYIEMDSFKGVDEFKAMYPQLQTYLDELLDSEHWSDEEDGVMVVVKSLTDDTGVFANVLESKNIPFSTSQVDED